MILNAFALGVLVCAGDRMILHISPLCDAARERRVDGWKLQDAERPRTLTKQRFCFVTIERALMDLRRHINS